MELGKLLEIRKLVQQDPPSHHAPVVMCTVKDRVQDSVLVVKMDVPLVVAEDVKEVVIQLVKALVLAVVKVDVIQHVRGDVIIGVLTGVVIVREDVPHTVHRVTGALAVGVHRIRVLPVHAQEHVWAVIWVLLKILDPTVQVILLAHSLQILMVLDIRPKVLLILDLLQVYLVHLMVLDIRIVGHPMVQ